MLLLRFPSLPSTQDWIRHWAKLGAAEGLAIQAVEQTAGRGRLDRSWWSPPETGLYLSLLLRPAIHLLHAPQLTMLASLAAIDACRSVAHLNPQPKWPNDLLLSGRKLAGVLTEIEENQGQLQYAIIGLGLNIGMSFANAPPPMNGTAISLTEASQQPVSVDAMRDAYLSNFEARYRRFQAGEMPLDEWKERLEPLGRRVRVPQSGRGVHGSEQTDIIGMASGVDPNGALLVQDDLGAIFTIWAGDVIPIAI